MVSLAYFKGKYTNSKHWNQFHYLMIVKPTSSRHSIYLKVMELCSLLYSGFFAMLLFDHNEQLFHIYEQICIGIYAYFFSLNFLSVFSGLKFLSIMNCCFWQNHPIMISLDSFLTLLNNMKLFFHGEVEQIRTDLQVEPDYNIFKENQIVHLAIQKDQ